MESEEQGPSVLKVVYGCEYVSCRRREQHVAQTLMQYPREYLVKVVDVIELDCAVAIVMEKYEGDSSQLLHSLCTEGTPDNDGILLAIWAL